MLLIPACCSKCFYSDARFKDSEQRGTARARSPWLLILFIFLNLSTLPKTLSRGKSAHVFILISSQHKGAARTLKFPGRSIVAVRLGSVSTNPPSHVTNIPDARCVLVSRRRYLPRATSLLAHGDNHPAAEEKGQRGDK